MLDTQWHFHIPETNQLYQVALTCSKQALLLCLSQQRRLAQQSDTDGGACTQCTQPMLHLGYCITGSTQCINCIKAMHQCQHCSQPFELIHKQCACVEDNNKKTLVLF